MAQRSGRELKVFNNQFIVRKKLSSGSFGVVFAGEDKLTSQEVAMKIEKEENEENRSLDREVTAQALYLSKLQGLSGVPKMYWHGTEGAYSVLVIQLLGKDLAHYVKHLKRFSLKTVLLLGEQLLTTLEEIHNRSIVHRDLKPENILVGKGNANDQIYIVDFGISKIYRDSQGTHIPFKEGKPFIGTTRYASIGAHKGNELSRADDLESLIYVLIFLYKGVLPWQNLQKVSDRDKTKVVGQMKQKIDATTLCKDMPIQFIRYLDYVKKMHFKSQPDYKYLRQLFSQAAQAHEIVYDNKYDWLEFDKKHQELKSQQATNYPPQESGIAPSPKNSEVQLKEPRRGSQLINDGGNINSQFDFLRPPDPKGKALISRSSEKHKSIASACSSNRTFQSSIANVYQPSMLSAAKHKTVLVKANRQKEIEHSMLDIGETGGFQAIESIDDFDVLSHGETLFDRYSRLLKTQVKALLKQNMTKR